MNTRVQVEHCVTEMMTGIDIVKEGIRAAAGEPLSYAQDDVELRGHAIECRINAEDASQELRAGAGQDRRLSRADGTGRARRLRASSAGGEVSPMYDPMVAKLIVWDADREQATQRMLRALGEYEIERLKTLIPFHGALLATEQWAKGRDVPRPARGQEVAEDARLRRTGARAGRRGGGAQVEQTYAVEVSGSASTCVSSGRRSPAVAR